MQLARVLDGTRSRRRRVSTARRLTLAGAGEAKTDKAVEGCGILAERRRRGVMDNAAPLQDERPVREAERDLRMLLHQDDGGAVVDPHASDRCRQLLDHDGRQTLE